MKEPNIAVRQSIANMLANIEGNTPRIVVIISL